MKWIGVAALSGALLASCASVAHVERDESVNMNQYRTYAWVETKESKNDTVKTKVSDLTERSIRQAVANELAKAGWKESKKPDVLLAYDVLVERGVRELNSPVYSQPFNRSFFNPYSRRWVNVFYPSTFMGYDREQMQVREGTITISIIDARTDKTVWQGWSTDELSSRNFKNKEVQNVVRSIFRKFDVARN
jgi:hypothetical protein